MEIDDAVRTVSAIGPYFALELNAAGPNWMPLSGLVNDPALLTSRVAAARSRLAERCGLDATAIDERATASVHFLGLASRLVSPALAMAVLTGDVPRLAVAQVSWRAVRSGPIPLSLHFDQADTTRSAQEPVDLARLIAEDVLAIGVAPLVEAFQCQFRLSTKVLWGNVASAFAGAAIMLGRVQPGLRRHTIAIMHEVLTATHLLGMGHYRANPDLGTTATESGQFQRNNCCLFYRVPGTVTCGDCVLNPALG